MRSGAKGVQRRPGHGRGLSHAPDLRSDPRPESGRRAPAGDIQYGSGRRAYALSYNPTWGRFKGIAWPAPGNHDFYRSAGADYFEYFGPAVGGFHNAYYSFDVGAWHLVSLNSNYDHCDEITGVDCGDAAVQLRWLRKDLAAHRNRCVLAYFHHPRFSSGPTGNNRRVAELWNALDAARADVVLSGHDHSYERFGPQDGEGRADPAGVRQFVVGTGGEELQNFTDELPNSQAVDTRTFGVLADPAGRLVRLALPPRAWRPL